MRDLYDTLFAPDRFARDKWEIEPDFDELAYDFDDELDEPSDEDDITLDEWLDANS